MTAYSVSLGIIINFFATTLHFYLFQCPLSSVASGEHTNLTLTIFSILPFAVLLLLSLLVPPYIRVRLTQQLNRPIGYL